MAHTLLMQHPLMLGSGVYNFILLMAATLGGFGVAWTLLARASPRAVRTERELVSALGEPLLAARPDGAQAVRILCEQLATYWLIGGRRLVPIVDAGSGEGGKDLAVELARAFAVRGRRTLLVDADLRS